MSLAAETTWPWVARLPNLSRRRARGAACRGAPSGGGRACSCRGRRRRRPSSRRSRCARRASRRPSRAGVIGSPGHPCAPRAKRPLHCGTPPASTPADDLRVLSDLRVQRAAHHIDLRRLPVATDLFCAISTLPRGLRGGRGATNRVAITGVDHLLCLEVVLRGRPLHAVDRDRVLREVREVAVRVVHRIEANDGARLTHDIVLKRARRSAPRLRRRRCRASRGRASCPDLRAHEAAWSGCARRWRRWGDRWRWRRRGR